MSDSDEDRKRCGLRRGRKREVNYRETSESEGSQATTNKDKAKSGRRLSSSNSDGQLLWLPSLPQIREVHVELDRLSFSECKQFITNPHSDTSGKKRFYK